MLNIWPSTKFCLTACILLFLASTSYWTNLQMKSGTTLAATRGCILGSNMLFAIALLCRWKISGYFPISNLYESLLFLAWGISSIQIFLELKLRSKLVGSIITPLLLLIGLFASLGLPYEMQKAVPLLPSLQSNWLMMHVSTMIISYALLIVGSLFSITYIGIIYSTKKKAKSQLKIGNSLLEPGVLLSINKNASLLQALDTWSYRIIGLGFPCLTLGIISGAVWANEAWGSYWSWDPKETWALITWLAFASYLHLRLTGNPENRAFASALCAFFALASLIICFLGSGLILGGLHSYASAFMFF